MVASMPGQTSFFTLAIVALQAHRSHAMTLLDQILSKPTGATIIKPTVESAPKVQPLPEKPVSVSAEDLLADSIVSDGGPLPQPLPPEERPPTVEAASGTGKRRYRKKADFDDVQKAIEPQKEPPNYNLMSNMLFDMTTGLLANTLGPEWLPKVEENAKEGDPTERGMVVGSLEEYLKSRKVEDIPPGLMLTVVVCAYSLPRIRQPSTASKLSMTWTWLKSKFIRRRKISLVPSIPIP